jgi:hypothetical protein
VKEFFNKLPSVQEVCQQIFDFRMFRTVEKVSQIPKGLSSCIIFSPLDDSITAQHFR